jgi:hypothetical protein
MFNTIHATRQHGGMVRMMRAGTLCGGSGRGVSGGDSSVLVVLVVAPASSSLPSGSAAPWACAYAGCGLRFGILEN